MVAFLARTTVVLLAALSLPSQALVPSATMQTSSLAVPLYSRWSATPYMSAASSYTLAQSLNIAQAFDLVVGKRTQFSHFVPQMKAVNPRLVILQYLNASYAPKTKTFASSWYAYDANGNRIRSVKYGAYLMDISNSAWVQWVDTQCSLVRPYDGCFLDQLGSHLLRPGYLTSLPINARTGRVWTSTEWMNATTSEAKRIVADNPAAVIIGNGLHDGQSYYDPVAPSSQLYDALSSGLAETWLRQANYPVGQFKKEGDWLMDVNMIIDAANRGRTIMVSIKIWVSVTKAQISQWHTYSLASFLLATQGNAYYEFLAPNTAAAFIDPYVGFQVHLGSPLAPFFRGNDGMYHRNWSGGTVWVNPTPNQYVLKIAQTCTTLSGQVLIAPTTYTVRPETGDVCIAS